MTFVCTIHFMYFIQRTQKLAFQIVKDNVKNFEKETVTAVWLCNIWCLCAIQNMDCYNDDSKMLIS
jgi:hypothetical protein